MGNAAGKLTPCLCPASNVGDISQRHADISVVLRNPLHDDGLGHSFCYIPPLHSSSDHHHHHQQSHFFNGNLTTTSQPPSSSSAAAAAAASSLCIRTISGASISANTSTPLSTTLLLDAYNNNNNSCTASTTTMDRASSFESSSSFASVPLQPIPRNLINSGPLPSTRGSGSGPGPAPNDRGFMSGPIERGVLSGPIDQQRTNPKLERIKSKYEFNKWGSIKGIKDSILGALLGNHHRKTGYDSIKDASDDPYNNDKSSSLVNFSCPMSLTDENNEGGDDVANNNNNNNYYYNNNNVQWAQAKAGEDRVQVFISEDHGWVFVGIYDGFNGPDAPDFLLSNLYSALDKELKALLRDSRSESDSGSVSALASASASASNQSTISKDSSVGMMNQQCDEEVNHCSRRLSGLNCSSSWCADDQQEQINGLCENDDPSMSKEQIERNDRQMLELDEKVREKLNHMGMGMGMGMGVGVGMSWPQNIRHSDVLRALSEALRKTEEAYLDVADKMVKENPELSLMGSCVLVMLMIGEDIYLMNVGDSRAVLGQKPAPEADDLVEFPHISSLQLTVDHNTYVKEEVQRIKKEHPDDPFAVANERVKGSLKVTRAFGAGFLKQPKWNEALLEMFRIDYIGNSPYLTCSPSLYHHKVSPKDKFLILSSDGLYQYFTNDEAVSAIELFMTSTPEGDPAKHLVEEVLFRAAKKAGMDFNDLLEIPQGERRRYHDDVCLIVIPLERRI